MGNAGGGKFDLPNRAAQEELWLAETLERGGAMTDKPMPDLVAEIVAREIGTPPAPDRSIGTRALEYLCAALMVLLAGLLLTQVIGRYALSDPPEWTEELARAVFVYVTFIAAAIAVVRKAHLKIDSVTSSLPRRAQAAVNTIGIAAALVFLGFVIYYGTGMLDKLYYQELSAVPISKAYVFAAVPIGCALIAIYECGRLFKELKALVSGDSASNVGGGA
jgi:TRAP-type C4-dicarboxylate transport system permease small subunit